MIIVPLVLLFALSCCSVGHMHLFDLMESSHPVVGGPKWALGGGGAGPPCPHWLYVQGL